VKEEDVLEVCSTQSDGGARFAVIMKRFLENCGIIYHPPDPPALAPPDFLLFPKT